MTQLDFSKQFPDAVYNIDARQKKGQKIIAVLSSFFKNDLKGKKVLDIGCSAGIISKMLAQRTHFAVGMDPDRQALSFANKGCLTNTLFLAGDGQRLPFPGSTFDIVICAHVYEHIEDPRLLVDEIYRVLKCNGVCFFAAGNRLSLMEPHYNIPLLSIFPSSIANRYLRIAGKGRFYREKHLTYWGLKRLLSQFHITDYTGEIISHPQKFAATDVCIPGSTKQRLAKMIYHVAPWLIPTYIFLLEKDDYDVRNA